MRPIALATVGLLLLTAGCGDDAVTTTAPVAPTTQMSVTTSTAPTPAPSPDLDLELAPAELCESILPVDRVVEFLGQPAGFDADSGNGYDPRLGLVTCSWSSVDEGGIPVETLGLQFYLGDPVPGENFYLPSEWPEIRVIDDLGDDAYFASVQIRRTASFLWDSYVVTLDYWPFLIEASGYASADELIDLLREVRDRNF